MLHSSLLTPTPDPSSSLLYPSHSKSLPSFLQIACFSSRLAQASQTRSGIVHYTTMPVIAAYRNITRRLSFHGHCLIQRISTYSYLSEDISLSHSDGHWTCSNQRVFKQETPVINLRPLSTRKSPIFLPHTMSSKWQPCRLISSASLELKTDQDVVRFNFENAKVKGGSWKKVAGTGRKVKMSRKAKLNELRFYRLKAKKKMNSPNPEVTIKYKLEKAKRKEAWLIEKLRKFEVPTALAEAHDPEILTEEEKFYLKRTGEKKKHYVPVGRRGVFGGVVLNMHLHWKKHETVKVVCKPCKPGQIHEYVAELARLSKGIVIDIKPDNTVIFFRGKNYVQPDIMCPADTLSKAKALEKYKFEQSLEHTSQFVEKLEKELEEYHEHLARYHKEKNT